MSLSPGTDTASQSLRSARTALQGPLLVALLYFLGAEAAFFIGTLSDKIFALFWPPNVVLFCALLIVPYQRWWRYLVAALPAHTIAELMVGMPILQLLIAFITNCTAALLNAYAVRYWIGGAPWFSTFRTTLIYILIAAGVSPAISALGGAFVPILGSGGLSDYWIFWSHWYLANALPNLTLGPVFLIWFADRGQWQLWFVPRRQIEPLMIAAAIAGSCFIAAALAGHLRDSSFLAAVFFLPLPFVSWAAVRYGEKGAGAGVLLVTVILTSLTLRAPGLFPEEKPDRDVLALQLFLMGLSIPLLLLGASIDDLRRTERSTRELATSVLRTQDQERRRIARELHDSTGQNLIAGTLIARRIQELMPPSAEPLMDQLNGVLQQSISELRTLSYLLHPPLLDEAGLGTALRCYVDGFVERSGIIVYLDVMSDFGRLTADIELVLFRIVQEALTNVSRHANSPTAYIQLRRQHRASGEVVDLTIEDAGRGMPQARVRALTSTATRQGLGLASMRERLHEIGGRLEIESEEGRTCVRAVIPLHGRFG